VTAVVSLKCTPTQRLLNKDISEDLSRQNCRLDQSDIGRTQTAETAHCDIETITPNTSMNRAKIVSEQTEPKRKRRARTVRAIGCRDSDDKFRASDAVKYGTIPAKYRGVPEQKPKYRRQTAQNTVGGSAVSRKDGGESTMRKKQLQNSTAFSLFDKLHAGPSGRLHFYFKCTTN